MEVSRDDLLLTGSSGQELVDSVSAWAERRLAATGCQIWILDRDGFYLFASAGEQWTESDREMAREAVIARRFRRDTLRAVHPLVEVGGRSGAVLLCLGSEAPAKLAEPMQRAAELLSLRVPAALEMQRLNSAVTRLAEAERMQRALYTIAGLANSGRDLSELLGLIHGLVAGLMYAENFFVVLRDRRSGDISFPYFLDSQDRSAPRPDQTFSLGEMQGSLAAYVVTTGESLMGPSDLLCLQIGADRGHFGPASVDWLGVPLSFAGDVFGAVCVQSYNEQFHYSNRERDLLTFVALHLSSALQQRWTQIELERRVDERTDELREANKALRAEVEERQRGEQLHAALFRIAELGAGQGTLEDFFAAVHRVIGRLLYAANFYIAMLSDDGRTIDFPYSVDERDAERERREIGRGLTEYVLRTGQALLADREMIDQLHDSNEIISYGPRAKVWLGVPLICESGTVGVLAVQSYDSAHSYSRRDQEILTFVSIHIGNALERVRAAERLRQANAELEDRVRDRTQALFAANRDLRQQIAERERFERELKYAANHDSLTGLPNRAAFMQRLAQALARYSRRQQDRFGILFLDLDRFKVINDSMGHWVGDGLLKEVAQRLSNVVSGRGLVSRLGGDEFAILMEAIESEADAVLLAEQVIVALNEAIFVEGKELFSSTSIGIAVSRPIYRSPEELLRDADVALYRAKARGRRCFEVFDDQLRHQALCQLELESDLRRAVARHEFEPVFQPIYRIENGEVVGYEALIRWRHPERGQLLPEEFLSTAEETGLLEAMDWQVYELVFAQAWVLVKDGGYVTINVGGRHFRSARFVDRLLQLMARYEFHAEHLRVEVTERILIEEPEKVREMMLELKAAGVRLALDDFGTGYSSLSYLHQFPLHALKIDRSFVTALHTGSGGNAIAVLRAICTLGRSLDLEVIAEGLETESQLDVVRSLGCQYGQGYLYATPQPVHALLAQRDGVRLVDTGAGRRYQLQS
ncbi:GGDEF domain-containing protein [Pseudomarimonas arenosa]|uniref:EAL domain-containing protein n=1 Tax=Pseudomarimonas arenosa TaxID=2774145 RepID=A0AAW3ZKJ9_9GAMM|nr:GGDEF domain-containing protein [Pseudomarimonas arenosa]MBD8524981.1 EAL domain-containing protein [Pseudomarimonas arenosa]